MQNYISTLIKQISPLYRSLIILLHIIINTVTGSHLFEITYRENGCKLDKFVVQLATKPAPSGSGPAESIK